MKLAGFNFTKINAEINGPMEKEAKINSSIDISNIEEIKGGIFTKEQLIKISFKYSINYKPEYAKIELDGVVVISGESKVVKEILNDWKEKKLSEEVRMGIFNLIIKKAGIKALQLEDEMGLPYHMPFPSLRKQENSEKK